MTQTVAQGARDVLLTGPVDAKVMAARKLARDWRLGRLMPVWDVAMPDRPARPTAPELLPPQAMPKRGKGGSARGRVALLHALAHIEFVAIDLAIDLVGRFGDAFPCGFTDDWLNVAADEAMHFALLDRRLRQLGSGYGVMPAHDGLWESAEATADDALARLAIVPMVLEARGLDVTPATVARFEAAGDPVSARILSRIYHDEIRHVAAGTQWFESGCSTRGLHPPTAWSNLVQTRFRGLIKPPFNDSARRAAGLTQEYMASVAY